MYSFLRLIKMPLRPLPRKAKDKPIYASVVGTLPTEWAFDKMLAARCTQNAQGRRFSARVLVHKFAQALIEFIRLIV